MLPPTRARLVRKVVVEQWRFSKGPVADLPPMSRAGWLMEGLTALDTPTHLLCPAAGLRDRRDLFRRVVGGGRRKRRSGG